MIRVVLLGDRQRYSGRTTAPHLLARPFAAERYGFQFTMGAVRRGSKPAPSASLLTGLAIILPHAA